MNLFKILKLVRVLSLTLILIIFLSYSVFSEVLVFNVANITITPGTDESELRFTWHTLEEGVKPALQVALKSNMVRDSFPELEMLTFYADSISTGRSTVNKAVVSGLVSSTEYVYRVGDEETYEWSNLYYFTTMDALEFSILFLGDVQIGAYNIPIMYP